MNSASAIALQTVPGIDEALSEAIVSARAGLTEESMQSTAWLFADRIVEAEEYREIAPHLTARGFQYSFRVIGYGAKTGQYRMLEVVIDTVGGEPEIVYLRDITRLGPPFPLIDSNEVGAELAGAESF